MRLWPRFTADHGDLELSVEENVLVTSSSSGVQRAEHVDAPTAWRAFEAAIRTRRECGQVELGALLELVRGEERVCLELPLAPRLRIRCLKRRDGEGSQRGADCRACAPAQSDDSCCSAGGGTVTCPIGRSSSRGSRRARVAAQYLGESSR